VALIARLASVRIREREDGDIPACVELFRETHESDDYPRFWPRDPRRFIAPPYETVAWVAEVDRRVCGHVALHEAGVDPTFETANRVTGKDADELAVVARLLTRPTSRRSGVGRALLEHATGAAHDRGRQPVLDVGKALEAPIGLYEACGWQRIGDFRLQLPEGQLDLWVYLGPEPR
jgi:GNAT superfamily N-acetyltransferase